MQFKYEFLFFKDEKHKIKINSYKTNKKKLFLCLCSELKARIMYKKEQLVLMET